MNSTGIILTLAYPETIVMVADEWYSPYMCYLGVGKKNYVRAGHAALVLIDKILNDHHLFIAPGTIFGTNGEGYIRFSLCAPKESIELAIQRVL